MDFGFNEKEINFDDIENDSELLDELAALGWNHDHDRKPSWAIKPPKPIADTSKNSTQAKPAVLSHQPSTQLEINKLVLNNNNNDDDDHVNFNEEDESDPELLLAFASIQNAVNEESSTSIGVTTVTSATAELSTNSNYYESSNLTSITTTTNNLSSPSNIVLPAASAPITAIIPETNLSSRQDTMMSSLPPPVSSPRQILPRNDSTTTNKTVINMDNCTVADARKMAAKCKRGGNIEEALKWMKRSKVLEKGDEIKTAVTSSTSASTAVTSSSSSSSGSQAPKVSQNTASIPLTQPITATTKTKQTQQIPPNQKAINVASSSSSSSSGNGNISNGTGDMFSPLEKALTEAANVNLEEAKRLKALGSNNNTEAVMKLREYKKYSQELDVLRGRRVVVDALPAVFKWQTVRKEKKIENTDIGEDQLKFLIVKVSGLNALLQPYSSRSICIIYDFGFPKDEPIVGKLNSAVNKEGIAELNFNTCISSVIKRTTKNLTANMMTRKKVQFELVLKRGFLFSDISLGTASLPLTDLLTKCECGGVLPMMMEDAKGRKQVVAGTIEAYIRLRSPIAGPEVTATEERILLLDPWPEVNVHASSNDSNSNNNSSATTNSSNSNKASSSATVATTAIVSSPASTLSATTANTASTMIATSTVSDAFADISDMEKTDPCNVTFLLSNDVLEDEKTRITAEIASMKNKNNNKENEDKLFHLNLRLQLVNTKLDILVRSVQEGQISMEDYLRMLKDRMKRDLKLLQYLKSPSFQPLLSDEDDVTTTSSALYLSKQVTHRVLVMQKEIKGAEEAAQSDD